MYQINVEFNDSATHQEVAGWLDTIVLPSLPENAKATINLSEIAMSADDLTEDHIGYKVRFAAKDGREVIGKLDNVLPTNRDYAKVLVVDGIAHHVTFGVVRITT
jgi:hypothetical protein